MGYNRLQIWQRNQDLIFSLFLLLWQSIINQVTWDHFVEKHKVLMLRDKIGKPQLLSLHAFLFKRRGFLTLIFSEAWKWMLLNKLVIFYRDRFNPSAPHPERCFSISRIQPYGKWFHVCLKNLLLCLLKTLYF